MISDIFNLDNKIALVTGASSGLGKRFSIVLAKAGATVIVVARRAQLLKDLVAEIESMGGKAHAIVADLSNENSIKELFLQAQRKFHSLDIVVNNVGAATLTPLLDSDIQEWDFQMNLNLRSMWILIQQSVPWMISSKSPGSIINIASINGLRPVKSASAYCVTKAGVIQLTKSLVSELSAYNIRINAIAPGYFSTSSDADQNDAVMQELNSRIPLGFVARPEHLDGTLLYLASNNASGYVSGSVMCVDGGLIAGEI